MVRICSTNARRWKSLPQVSVRKLSRSVASSISRARLARLLASVRSMFRTYQQSPIRWFSRHARGAWTPTQSTQSKPESRRRELNP